MKAMTYYQSKLEKEVQGIIECGSAHTKLIVMIKLCTQVIKCEMSVNVIYSFKNCIAFWSLAMIIHLKIGVEYTQHILPDINFYHTATGAIYENRTKVQTFSEKKER